VKVCLLDKNIWPRYKACGGAVSRQAEAFLPPDRTQVLQSKLNGITFLFHMTNPVEIHRNELIAQTVMRDEFDLFLL
jgi:flavin-dependent dehydrogenase